MNDTEFPKFTYAILTGPLRELFRIVSTIPLYVDEAGLFVFYDWT